MPEHTVVTAAVEGDLDEAVFLRLADHVGAIAGPIYGKNGKKPIIQKLAGYNAAARLSRWFVLVDLDREFDCAKLLRLARIPNPSLLMCFRVAVQEVESWLLSDAVGIAAFLRASRTLVPRNPEAESDPKSVVVGIARRSASREIRQLLVPRPESGRNVGPGYNAELARFVRDSWDIRRASSTSESLRRAVRCLQTLAARPTST